MSCPVKSDIYFTVVYDNEKQQILKFEKLEPGNVGRVALMIKKSLKQLLDYRNICRSIHGWSTNKLFD